MFALVSLISPACVVSTVTWHAAFQAHSHATRCTVCRATDVKPNLKPYNGSLPVNGRRCRTAPP